MHSLILFVHLLGAFALAAGNAAGLSATICARRTKSPQTVLALMSLHHHAVFWLVIPGSILVLLTGLYLVRALDMPLGSLWIAASLVAWLIAFLLGIIVLVPAEKNAIREAIRLVEHNAPESSPELRSHVGARSVVIGEWAQVALIVLFLWLMVFKPA